MGKCVFLDHFILKIMSPRFFWLPCLFVSVVLCLLMVIHIGPHSFLSVNLLISLSKEAVPREWFLKAIGTRAGFLLCVLCMFFPPPLFPVFSPCSDSGHQ